MRTEVVLIVGLFAAVLLSGCMGPSCVIGSGNLINETRMVDSFNSIELQGSSNLYLTQGLPQPLRIEAEDNILKALNIHVEAGKLIIGTEACITTTKPIKIYATTKDVNRLEISGSGTISSKSKILADSLDLALSGTGIIDLELKAKRVRTEMAGSGTIRLRGAADDHNTFISGSGKIGAYDLTTKRSKISISGSGVAQVNVSQEIDARISDSGMVYYRENPDKISKEISGVGDMQKAA